jgi:hypothetical protein
VGGPIEGFGRRNPPAQKHVKSRHNRPNGDIRAITITHLLPRYEENGGAGSDDEASRSSFPGFLAGWPASQLTLSHNRSPVNPCVLDRVVNKSRWVAGIGRATVTAALSVLAAGTAYFGLGIWRPQDLFEPGTNGSAFLRWTWNNRNANAVMATGFGRDADGHCEAMTPTRFLGFIMTTRRSRLLLLLPAAAWLNGPTASANCQRRVSGGIETAGAQRMETT